MGGSSFDFRRRQVTASPEWQPGRAKTRWRCRRGLESDPRTVNRMQNLPPRFTPVTRGSFESSLMLGDPPMHSSSANPTPIPSSDVATRDHSAVDARMETRRQDTTEGFPVGLIPQLIDVLHILTEGQGLLSGKLRAARLDESSHSCRHVVGSSSTPFEIPRARPAEHGELDGETTRANSFGMNYPSDPGADVGDPVASPASVPESAPSSDSPTTINARVTNEPVAHSVSLESEASAGTSASPLHRDYNFFDELDAKLASLQDSSG
jgi:hypothetical protein